MAGTLNSWSLTFQKPIPATGLGEPVADRTTASFRIFNMDPENPLASNGWTSVGPAGVGAQRPASTPRSPAASTRSPSIRPTRRATPSTSARPPAASGRRPTSCTTSPAGPTWIPLLDEAPTGGLRISSITVVGRNNDPNQSILFAATGDGPALGDPLRPSSLTAQGPRLPPLARRRATWTLLDSSNNNLPFASRDHVFAAGNGTAAFKVVADPQLTPGGEAIVYAALSDVAANGRDTYTTVNGGLWRSVDSGKHLAADAPPARRPTSCST